MRTRPTSSQPKPEAPGGGAADLVKLKPDDVRVDKEVQRDFNEHHDIFKTPFDPSLFGAGYVSIRSDGSIVCLDGQHRGEYAKLAGYGQREFPYYAYRGLSRSQEASLFRRLQEGRCRVGATDLYRVGKTAKRPDVLAIQAALQKHGVKKTPQAVGALMRLFRQHGESGGSLTIDVLQSAWGKEREAFDGMLLRGVGAFISRHREQVDLGRLKSVLQKAGTPAFVIGRIKGQKMQSPDVETAACIVLKGIYNKHLTTNKLT